MQAETRFASVMSDLSEELMCNRFNGANAGGFVDIMPSVRPEAGQFQHTVTANSYSIDDLGID